MVTTSLSRAHSALDAHVPEMQGAAAKTVIPMKEYRWEKHCHNLFDLPIAA